MFPVEQICVLFSVDEALTLNALKTAYWEICAFSVDEALTLNALKTTYWGLLPKPSPLKTRQDLMRRRHDAIVQSQCHQIVRDAVNIGHSIDATYFASKLD